MQEDLEKEIADMHRRLALREKGSVKKAQELAKRVRKAGHRQAATFLIRKSNEAAKFLPKDLW